MQGDFSLYTGQVLSVLVGMQGDSNTYPGGGGGSFVALGGSFSTATPLIVAGGGGSAVISAAVNLWSTCGGQITQTGAGSYSNILPGYGAASAPCGGNNCKTLINKPTNPDNFEK
jgi:hypothetical protein